MHNSISHTLRDLQTRRLLIAFVTASIAVACGSTSSETGSTAPDFSLPVANLSVDITLSDFRGEQNVVLVFYRGFF